MNLKNELKKYASVFKIAFNEAMVYRFSFIVWAVLHPVYIGVMYFVWTSIYQNTGAMALGGLTVSQIITYYVVNVVLNRWVGVDLRISEEVRMGYANITLIKPINYIVNQIFVELGHRLTAVIFEMLPIAIIAYFIFDFRIVSMEFTLLALISSFLGLLLNFMYALLFGLTTFWTTEYFGTRGVKEGLLNILSGYLIPISLFPAAVQNILYLTPFPYIGFVPSMVFLGKFTFQECFKMMGIQIVWIILLYFFAKFVFEKARKQFTGVGT